MHGIVRAAGTAFIGICTFYLSFWTVGSAVIGVGAPPVSAISTSLLLAMAAAWVVWTRSELPDLFLRMTLGAIVLGGLGFSAGFFGPMAFAPDANQGPLLGIFITGPLGAVIGAVGGATWWSRGRRPDSQAR